MDYDAVAAHFLIPTGAELPMPTVESTPARRLRDALEPIATIGWWSREAAAAVHALGHDFFDGYAWGRAAALGADVSPAVVVAAFGAFEPRMLTEVYTHARTISTRDEMLAARGAGATAGLVAATGGVDETAVSWLGDRLLAALDHVDGAGRPLFSGLRDLAVPDSPHGRAWRASELVREHRGDGHIAAVVASGFDMIEMNVLTEVWLEYPVGEYSSTRAFGATRISEAAERLRTRGLLDGSGRLTPSGRAVRDGIELATDESQRALVDAIGSELDEVVRVADMLGTAVLDAHAAPADARKRAAG